MLRIVAVAVLASVAFAAFIQPENGNVENSYIVVMNGNATFNTVSLKLNANGVAIKSVWSFGGFHGFQAEKPEVMATEDFVTFLESQPGVKYVVADQIMSIQQTCQTQTLSNPTGLWGLDRVSKRQNVKDGRYYYDTTGAGVDVYVLDTGIYVQHTDFAGRAIWGSNFADFQNTDCNGHGTHCAGTIGGRTYGVAKGANLIAVKVLSCAGSGSTAGIISGIDWVVNRYYQVGRPSVASMSLGGGKNVALDDAVDAAIEEGISFVVAAGNDNNDACRTSPAGVAAAITVGATETSDVRSTFSAWGSCVDIFAPGTNVLSAWIGGTTATRIISGTSMATPHVSGAVARYLQSNPNATPAQVTSAILAAGTANVLNLRCTTTGCQRSPNVLLYDRCAGQE